MNISGPLYFVYVPIAWISYGIIHSYLPHMAKAVCSRTYLKKHLKGLKNKLFYTPLRERCRFGWYYWLNMAAFWLVLGSCVIGGLLWWSPFTRPIAAIFLCATLFLIAIPAIPASAIDARNTLGYRRVKTAEGKILYAIFSAVMPPAMAILWLFAVWFPPAPK